MKHYLKKFLKGCVEANSAYGSILADYYYYNATRNQRTNKTK